MPDLVFYDGGCGLCHGSVAFLARRDRDGSRFRFAPLGGETARGRLADMARLPDGTVVLLTADGRSLFRSDAVLHALGRLGGPWRHLAAAGRTLPRPFRDGAYGLVARVRRRLFAAPGGVCPRLPARLAARFLP